MAAVVPQGCLSSATDTSRPVPLRPPGAVSRHRAELPPMIPKDAAGSGGWWRELGLHSRSCTPKISPGRRLWEFPVIFTVNVLFIKLSHCCLVHGDRP